MSFITGYINDEFSNLQPLQAVAVLESGAVSGLSSSAVVKVTIPNLTVLKSVAVIDIEVDGEIVFPGTGRTLGQAGNVLYFSTTLANDAIAGKVPVVSYRIGSEDYDVVKNNLVNSSMSTKTVDLEINENDFTIAGASFSPPITNAPSIGRAVKWTGDNGLDVSGIIKEYVKNGSYYDVTISPLEEGIQNVKISII